MSAISMMEVLALLLLTIHFTLGDTLFRRLADNIPALENWRSEATEDAGMHKNLTAIFARPGKNPYPMRATTCEPPNAMEQLCLAGLLPEEKCTFVISNPRDEYLSTICYGELGCFPNYYPWVSANRPFPLPSHPSEVDVQISCYNSVSPKGLNITLWPKIDVGNCSLARLNSKHLYSKAVFITHGFVENPDLRWMYKITNDYIKKFDPVVFLVTWGKGADALSYLQGAANARIAGAEITRFLKFLNINHFLNYRDVHLIGHGLGAHVMSYVAKEVGGSRIRHLTALDPAQPGFEGMHAIVRVDINDAEFVEVVHTSAAPLLPNFGFGMISPVGDVDFYMNGGVHQPGCPIPEEDLNLPDIQSIKDLAFISAQELYEVVFCSHTRAYEYYSYAIEDYPFEHCNLGENVVEQHLFGDSCMFMGRKARLVMETNDIDPEYGLVEIEWTITSCSIYHCIAMGYKGPLFFTRGPVYAETHPSPPYCRKDHKYHPVAVFHELIEAHGSSGFAQYMRAIKQEDYELNLLKTDYPYIYRRPETYEGLCSGD